MKINGVQGINARMGVMAQATDSVSKNIQNQIANAQKKLSELSSNESLSVEEKAKKRQEIQEEIMNLKNQLKQHQAEQRKEKQQIKISFMENNFNESKNVFKNRDIYVSSTNMQNIISASSNISHARIQQASSKRLEGRSRVLESEIKMDASRGSNVEAKKEKLEEIKEKITSINISNINSLSNANKKLEDVENKEQLAKDKESKTEDKKKAKDKENNNVIIGESLGDVSKLKYERLISQLDNM